MSEHFAAPLILLGIPLLLFLVILGGRRKFIVGSVVPFNYSSGSWVSRIWRLAIYGLAAAIIFSGVSMGMAALAQPRSMETRIVEKEVEGRVAVLVDDISGSMNTSAPGEILPGGKPRTRLDVLKEANQGFLQEFCRKKEGEDLSVNFAGLVTFSDYAEIRMPPTRDCRLVLRRVKALKWSGGTAIHLGLWTGTLLIINFVDQGRLIPLEELRLIEASLEERILRLPEKRKEFCRSYQGLSLLLYTDGDFSGWFLTRERGNRRIALYTSGTNMMNPFHVIDLAKSLCINTYFWSVEDLPESYKAAFSLPPGTGFAMRTADFSPEKLRASYKDAARREAGTMRREVIQVYNPLAMRYVEISLGAVFLGALLLWSKRLQKHGGKEVKR